MKKLVCAAVVAGSMFAMADEAQKQEAPAPISSEVVKIEPKQRQITPEQQAKMREQRAKFMAERKAKREAQILEVVKKYVPEEDKARALVKELQEAMMAGRHNMTRHPPMTAKPGEAK